MAKKTQEQQEAWAKVRRQEIRLMWLIATLIAILTLYFTVLNLYVLMREELPSYRLEMSTTADNPQALRYEGFVDWSDACDLEGPAVRPRLLVGGSELPPLGAPIGLFIRANSPRTVTVGIPGSATPCRHRGRILLRKVKGPQELEAEVSVPVEVEVVGGWWRPLRVLWWWLIAVGVLMALLYLFCLWHFPSPTGSLRLRDVTGKNRVLRELLVLRKQKSSWIFPWRRSVIPLSKIWKQARVRVPLRSAGELIFVHPTLPALCLDRRRNKVWGRRGIAGRAARRSKTGLRKLSPFDIMWDKYEYCHLDAVGDIDITMSFTKKFSR